MSVEFGVFISPERPSYRDILDDVLLCEALGFHSAWISDHVIGMYQKPRRPQVRVLDDAGVTLFIHRFMGEDFKEETRLFAEEVIPSFSQV